MKVYFSAVILCVQALAASGFMSAAPVVSRSSSSLGMFGGTGSAPEEDLDQEAQAGLEATAKSMGMSPEEFKLAMRAREQLVETMDNKIVKTGSEDTIMVTRDVNNPPKTFEVIITEEGKALGREEVSKKLVELLKQGAKGAAKGRQEAQQDMLKWVQNNS